jgi:hypothetical protein
MAEQGTAKEEVKTQEGTTGQEPITQAEADKIFDKELDRYTQDNGSPSAAPEGKGQAEERKPEGDAAGKAAPATADDTKAKEEADRAVKEETEFLKGLGVPEGTEVPKALLPVLKKFRDDLEFERKEKRRWGDQNRQLSEQVKTLKGEHGKLALSQPITVDQIKAFREKHKGLISSLTPGAQRLWEDDDYVADKIATQRLLMENGGPAAGGADASRPGEAVQQPTEDQAKQAIAENISNIATSDVIKGSHPDIATVYASPEFRKWTDKLSDVEVMKLFSSDPRAHKELLDRYKAEQAWEADEASRGKDAKKKQQALGGLGDVTGGVRPAREETPDDILNMSDDEYDKRKSAAFARSGG